MEETMEMAIIALRQEFAVLVTHLAGRLTCDEGEKPKQLREIMLTKLNEFLDSFGNRNLFKDDYMKELVEKAKAITNGVDAKLLRDNGVLGEKFAVEMEEVEKQIDHAVEEIPRRKIRLAA